jgi:hypothetical protein
MRGRFTRADDDDGDKARSSYIRGLIPTLHRSRSGGGREEQGRARVPPDASIRRPVPTWRWRRGGLERVARLLSAALAAGRPSPCRCARPPPRRWTRWRWRSPRRRLLAPHPGRTVCGGVRWRGSRNSCGSATRRGQSWRWRTELLPHR